MKKIKYQKLKQNFGLFLHALYLKPFRRTGKVLGWQKHIKFFATPANLIAFIDHYDQFSVQQKRCCCAKCGSYILHKHFKDCFFFVPSTSKYSDVCCEHHCKHFSMTFVANNRIIFFK